MTLGDGFVIKGGAIYRFRKDLKMKGQTKTFSNNDGTYENPLSI